MMNPIRIGNIEYRETQSLEGDTYEEIVVWYDNTYYGAEAKMKRDGWTFDKDGDAHKDNFRISSGMFKSKQMCYVVAFVEWNRVHDEFHLRTVGTRPFDLTGKDASDFREVLNKIESEVAND